MENVKTEIKEKSPLGREISFCVDKAKVEQEKSAIVAEIKKTAEIEGFRKGKAPEAVVETKFAKLINENLYNRIIPDAYINIVKEKELMSVTEPDVYDVSIDDEGLKFKVYIELKPEVQLKKYKGIPVKRITPEQVTEEEVDNILAEWEKNPSLSTSIIDPVKRKAWREKILQQLDAYKKENALMQEDKQLWDAILKDVDFPVPEKMVREEAISYTEGYLSRMNLEGKSKEEVEKIAKDILDKVKPEAEVSVKRYLVLDKVAEVEGIKVEEKEINARIEEISRSAGEPLEQIRQKLEKADKIDSLREDLRIKKAFSFLRENAKFIEKIILPGEEKKLEIIK
ncbi:MAG: trigger factor [Candidatus Ratteibacteria bacterium]|jgi:FKBP-type peptidyl-prolyl cis-trans isomerase (trigger factor)